MGGIDHKYTDEIVCPYCGYEFDDSWEVNGDDGNLFCDECDKEFEYERNISVTYSTSKVVE